MAQYLNPFGFAHLIEPADRCVERGEKVGVIAADHLLVRRAFSLAQPHRALAIELGTIGPARFGGALSGEHSVPLKPFV
jgi:hypothetical protein